MQAYRRRGVATAAWAACVLVAGGGTGHTGAAMATNAPAEMTLQECLRTALERNRSRPASLHAVVAAEAQHRQALAGYWPHFALKGAYSIMDEPQNFIIPSAAIAVPPSSMGVPGSSFQTQSSSVTIPANAFGPGFPAQDVQLPVNSQTVTVPGQSFGVPGQVLVTPDHEIELMDRESWYAALEAQWLLWDGGLRKGLRTQTRAGVDAALESLRRTEREIADSVTRLFYGAVLARQVRQVGDDTLARMAATLAVTETMYQQGGGKVKKTDYLENKIMVETLRAAVAQLQKNQAMAEAALAYTIGWEWHQSVRPATNEIPFDPLSANLQALVGEAYEFSPDWKRLEAGLRAGEGAVDEAESGYYPKLALTGDLHKWWNDYDKGMATEENKEVSRKLGGE